MIISAFIIFLLTYLSNATYITLPITNNINYDYYSDHEKIILNKTFSIVSSEIIMGTPQQKIKVTLSSSKYYLYVISSNSDLSLFPFVTETFNSNNSMTYKKLTAYSDSIVTEYYIGYNSSDNFYFSSGRNIITKPILFQLAETLSKSNVNMTNAGILGLSVTYDKLSEEEIPPLSFIQSLKRTEIISSYAFSFDLKENLLIIGEYPHEINNDYDKNNYYFDKVPSINDTLHWGFNFDSIMDGRNTVYKTDDNLRNIPGIISFESDFIFGRSEYNTSVYENFFKKYVLKDLCQMDIIRNYIYYNCSKTEVNFSEFAPLKFFHSFFNYTFIFTYEDLFFEIGNRKYFLVCFERKPRYYANPYWIIGNVFLKKYKVVFEQDRKIIGVYLPKNNENISLKKEAKKYGILFWSLFLLFILCLCGFLYYLFNLKRQITRKKRATELIEDFDYTQQG